MKRGAMRVRGSQRRQGHQAVVGYSVAAKHLKQECIYRSIEDSQWFIVRAAVLEADIEYTRKAVGMPESTEGSQ